MIKLITDSASDIDFEYAYKNNISIIPLHVRFGDIDYKDGIDLTGKEFFLKLIESDELPKTSQISPFEFEEEFKKYPNDEIICITLSSKLSGTYQSAMIAKEEFNNVDIIDSMNVTVGEKILVQYANELIIRGLSKKEIIDELNKAKNDIVLYGLLDTLEYLKKGGRISAVTAAFGTVLQIKPVVEVKNGIVEVCGKARGSKNGQNKLREMVALHGIDFKKPIGLAYSGLSDELLNKYVNDSKDLYGDYNKFKNSLIGSTIGTHIGPGAIAVAFFKNN